MRRATGDTGSRMEAAMSRAESCTSPGRPQADPGRWPHGARARDVLQPEATGGEVAAPSSKGRHEDRQTGRARVPRRQRPAARGRLRCALSRRRREHAARHQRRRCARPGACHSGRRSARRRPLLPETSTGDCASRGPRSQDGRGRHRLSSPGRCRARMRRSGRAFRGSRQDRRCRAGKAALDLPVPRGASPDGTMAAFPTVVLTADSGRPGL